MCRGRLTRVWRAVRSAAVNPRRCTRRWLQPKTLRPPQACEACRSWSTSCEKARPPIWPFEPSGLVVEALQCGQFLLGAEPALRHGRLRHPNRLIVDRDWHRERMSVVVAVGERRPRRIGKPVGAPWTTSPTIASDRTVGAPRPGSAAVRQSPSGIRGRGQRRVQRGGGRPNISVAAPFVWRCLTGSTVAPFPHPAHRTGQADLPHPALGQDVTPSPTTGCDQAV
jgi:hypothetical protein